MAVGLVTNCGSTTNPKYPMTVPVGNTSYWVVACSDATATDNATATVLNPAGITRAAQNWVQVAGRGTTLQVCLRYTAGATTNMSPVIQVFGRDRTADEIAAGSTANYQRLKDGSGAHALTLTVDATNDVKTTAYGWTDCVEVDLNGCVEVLVAVKTAQSLSDNTEKSILVRVK